MEEKQKDLLKCETSGCRSALESNSGKKLYRLSCSLGWHFCSYRLGSPCWFPSSCLFMSILFSYPCILVYTAKKCVPGPQQSCNLFQHASKMDNVGAELQNYCGAVSACKWARNSYRSSQNVCAHLLNKNTSQRQHSVLRTKVKSSLNSAGQILSQLWRYFTCLPRLAQLESIFDPEKNFFLSLFVSILLKSATLAGLQLSLFHAP